MESKERSHIRKLLCEGESLGQTLKEVYLFLKNTNSHISFGFLAQKMDLASRSYLSDIINGKRKLPNKLALPLAQALGLEPAAQEYLAALASLENAQKETDINFWNEELKKLKKLFAMHQESFDAIKFSDLNFTVEVFCTLSLLPKGATKEELFSQFEEPEYPLVETSISQLLMMGALIEEKGKLYHRHEHLALGKENRIQEIVNYLRESLKEAHILCYKWFQRPQEAFFDSTILSVRKDDYEKLLPIFKKNIQKMKAELEMEQGDQIIQFGVQIYPKRFKRY